MVNLSSEDNYMECNECARAGLDFVSRLLYVLHTVCLGGKDLPGEVTSDANMCIMGTVLLFI